MTEKPQQVYLIYPRLGGFANDLLVQLENGQILYHVQSTLFAPLGKSYMILDDKMKEIMQTKQDNTVLFPVHTVFKKERPIASVGQLGFLPQNYFIDLNGHPKLIIRIPVFSGIFNLEGLDGSVAQIAQFRTKWIVAIDTDQNYAIILPLLAIIYKESSIGG